MAYNFWNQKYFWNDMIDKAPDNSTMVTNFDKNRLPIYEKAIQEYDKSEILYIKEDAYDMNGDFTGDMSLHCSEKGTDLSDFWDIFDKIKKEF
jgi:hypothetical protein